MSTACLPAPFGRVSVECAAGTLLRLELLPDAGPTRAPQDAGTRAVCAQIEAYLADPAHAFTLPLLPADSDFRRRVRAALQAIPAGETRSYGVLAAGLGSGARAVGQACAANPLPLVVPCHRVVARAGIGGFMHDRTGAVLQLKLWLLDHERRD